MLNAALAAAERLGDGAAQAYALAISAAPTPGRTAWTRWRCTTTGHCGACQDF
jgi:hypothetical protein